MRRSIIRDAIEPWLGVGLWLGAIVLPRVLFPAWPIAGVVSGIALPALYLALVPKTCMEGGGIMGCPLAMCQGGVLLMWLAVGARLLIRAWH